MNSLLCFNNDDSKLIIPGTKTPEVDFYDMDSNSNVDINSLLEKLRSMKTSPNRELPVQPVFPTHITPEVQYGNERADTEKIRTPKQMTEDNTVLPLDSTLKPHITQHPEKPLAIYLNEDVTTSIENLTHDESSLYTRPKITESREEEAEIQTVNYEVTQSNKIKQVATESAPVRRKEHYNQLYSTNVNMNFTSGHSKVFGIGMEDAASLKPTTQSTVYNTKVSPTLPVWRDGDSTTLKYPVNVPDGMFCVFFECLARLIVVNVLKDEHNVLIALCISQIYIHATYTPHCTAL